MDQASQPPPSSTLLAAAAGGFGGALLGAAAAAMLMGSGDNGDNQATNITTDKPVAEAVEMVAAEH